VKKLILATTIALGLASGVTLAQEQTQTTELQNVVVTGQSYETYVADLDTGYQLHALVGHTHRQYTQARRAAEAAESLRRQGLALQPLVSVAIDDSSAPGVARQIQLFNAARETVAIVNVYCKRIVPSGGPHCRLDPRPTRAAMSNQRVATTQAGGPQLAVAVQD
jgi:hypothetical protein